MKKLLSLLAASGLVATTSATVVACGDPNDSTSKNEAEKALKDAKAVIEKSEGYASKDDITKDLEDSFKDSNVIVNAKDNQAAEGKLKLVITEAPTNETKWSKAPVFVIYNIEVFEAEVKETTQTPETKEETTTYIWASEAKTNGAATAKIIEVVKPVLSSDVNEVIELTGNLTEDVTITIDNAQTNDEGNAIGVLMLDKNTETGKSAEIDLATAEPGKTSVEGDFLKVTFKSVKGNVVKLQLQANGITPKKQTLTINYDIADQISFDYTADNQIEQTK